MDIGTNKPTKEVQGCLKHHLLDIKDPSEPYNAGEFGHLANNAIRDIRKRNILPVIVAGTPLYLHTFLYGLMDVPSASPELRVKFEQEAKSNGVESLWERLKQIDQERASQIHPHNLRRIIRALEIYELTGSTMSDLVKTTKPYRGKIFLFGLKWPREELYKRINNRVDLMFECGLVEEVQSLLKKPQNRWTPALQAIGYKEIVKYLDGKNTLDEAIEEVKKNTRRFARKQMAWWKREKNIIWLECRHQRDISESAKLIMQQVNSTFI
jgi:tRNA dimethylallyltransferase